MPKRNLAIVAAALVVLAVGLVLATSGSDSTSTSTEADRDAATPTAATTPGSSTSTPTTTATTPAAPPVPVVRIVDGKPDGGVEKLEFTKGDRVRFKVVSDVADEVHVHGFDKMEDVEAGGSVSFDFRASSDGIYEVELEDAGEQIASLVVNPS